MATSTELNTGGGGAVAAPEHLKRELGVGAIVFMVVAGAAPLGIVAASIPIILIYSGSTAAPLYYLIAAAILVLFAVGFTRMSQFVHNAGAFYTYIQAGLGRVAGLGAGTLALVSYTVAILSAITYFGVAGSAVVQSYLGVDLPWWTLSLASVLIVGFLGFRNIDLSSKVLGVLLILEVVVVLVMDIGILVHGGRDGITGQPFDLSALAGPGVGLGLMFAFSSFVGFEATAVFRSEAKDPARTIPRATYIAVLLIGGVYALSAFAIVVGLGVSDAVSSATADPVNVVLNLASTYVAPILFDVMQILLVTSFFACILSFHNVIARYQFTLARSSALPAWLGKVHPRHFAPSSSSLALSIVCAVLMVGVVLSGLDPVTQVYAWLGGAATLGIMVLLVLTCVAVIVYFRRHRTGHSPWATLVAPAVALVGLLWLVYLIVSNLTLLVGTPEAAWVVEGALILAFAAGVAIAMVMRTRRPADFARLNAKEAGE